MPPAPGAEAQSPIRLTPKAAYPRSTASSCGRIGALKALVRASAFSGLVLCVACAGSRPSNARDPAKGCGTCQEQRTETRNSEIRSVWPPSVVAVKGDHVTISAGSRDRVHVGDYFDLTRAGVYIGRLVIAVVERDVATGTLDTPRNVAPPAVGDSATRVSDLERLPRWTPAPA